jgi:hypothetical protein
MMTNEQRQLVADFAASLTAAIRRILGVTGPIQPGWYRPSQLTARQRERISHETMPLIMRFAHRAQSRVRP